MITRFMGLIVLSMGVQFALTGLRKFGSLIRVCAHHDVCAASDAKRRSCTLSKQVWR